MFVYMKRIAILGVRGMLGSDLRKVFADEAPYVLDKDELDITNRDAVFQVFKSIKPEIVISAAAYTDVDGCETNRDLAMNVNGKAPGYLAEAASQCGAVLVHYSTDYVFDGKKAEGYREDDTPVNPVNFYGESKLAGENAIRDAGGNYYIIRTSWLFGLGPSFAPASPRLRRASKASEGGPKNFVETMLRLSEEKNELRVVNDQHGKPTFTLDLAKATKKLLDDKNDFGIYHITNEPATTWYDFARAIINKKNITRRIQKSDDRLSFVYPCSSREYPRLAQRPAYSILLNTKLPLLRPWQEALAEYLSLRN